MRFRNMMLCVCLAAVFGCGGGVVEMPGDTAPDDQRTSPDAVGYFDGTAEVDLALQDAPSELLSELKFELLGDGSTDLGGLECQPGEGCFLDACTDNSQCQSGWCVEHMGEGVCTVHCQEECPEGWSCQQVAGTDPDLVFVCVSNFANLCRPCASGADCKSIGGKEDLCTKYGEQGSFCGGACKTDADCPFGFSCAETESVDGLESMQCTTDAGICPCTQKSVDLMLWTPCTNENELGICDGKRVCTEDGLSPCDAGVPEPEICNGIDDDCDGDLDEPDEVDGDYVNLCHDHNPCTDDNCTGQEGCENVPLDGTECGDEDPCTVADHCVAGACEGTPVVCDDNNLCTDDSCGSGGGCEFTPNSTDCDDSDPCTLGDKCSEGQCGGVAVACDCQVDEDCLALEDGNLCNGTLYCDQQQIPYHCAVDELSVVDCPGPEGGDAFCQAPACNHDTGECSIVNDHEGFACDDGDPCTLGDKCVAGDCIGADPTNCTDGNPCTDDGCDPVVGCTHVNNVAPCQDGDACTVGDACFEGQCQAGQVQQCDDGNVCTDDSCDPELGCVHQANQAACDDGSACTIGDQCAGGSCGHSGQLDCNDGNLCTDDSCDPAEGCINVDNSAPCDDGNACTVGDTCQASGCQPGKLLNCDDGNVCTDDSCHPQVGCLHEDNQAPCDDDNVCTENELCQDGECVVDTLLDCDDDNPCTTDLCNLIEGCTHINNSDPCDDDDACTEPGFCQAGQCNLGPAVDCDDSNPCTTETCDPQEGCGYELNQAECDDADACTAGDSCLDGVCQPGGALDCDDDSPCTEDSCQSDIGCVYVNLDGNCDDGDACTSDDACVAGLCVGQAVDCDDGSSCTLDSCDVDAGCQHALVEPCCGNGLVEPPEQCDDGNLSNEDNCTTLCQEAACDDGFANGDETDLDCGGSCLPCPDDSGCLEDVDCESGVCSDGVCQAPTCEDQVTNGDETDQDCGGSCDLCSDGEQCLEDKDCESGVCLDGECQVPTCDDQVQNGDEADLDCGGGCPGCAVDQNCVLPEDCLSLMCEDGICVAPQCEDGKKNGQETGVDCGGPDCDPCGIGEGCEQELDCVQEALCAKGLCSLYGPGDDGELKVTSGTVTINTVASKATGDADSSTLTIDPGVAGFEAGQRVLVHQTTGAGAGTWEEHNVASRDGANLTLTSPLYKSYASGAQVVVVPQYTSVAVTGGTLTAPAYNGSTGGILAFVASGAIAIQGGSVSMSGRGFRGKGHGCLYRCQDGHSGESPTGAMGTGTSPNANGMGGGGGQRGQDCAAGGGGGYGTAGAKGPNGSKGACHVGQHLGGTGGGSGGLADLFESILFGGAGGEGGGDEDGGNPGKGGNSGGIIIFKGPTVHVAAAVVSAGSNGAGGNQGSCGGWGCGMSGGGGGAGGAIYIVGETVNLSSQKATALGGSGGACTCGGSYNGGIGGVGRIAVRSPNAVGTTLPAFAALDPWQ